MKLNKKGYMLVEIIISFTIAMGIAYYLMNLTYKFKNVVEDIYQDTLYMKDKENITKNIMNDLDNKTIKSITESTNTVSFSIKEDNFQRKIKITRNDNGTTIEYGKVDGNHFIEDETYYKKNFEKSLQVGNIETKIINDMIVTIKIDARSIYNDNDYSVKLTIPYTK